MSSIQSKKAGNIIPVISFFASKSTYYLSKEILVAEPQQADDIKPSLREERYISHALVEIKRFKNIPLFTITTNAFSD